MKTLLILALLSTKSLAYGDQEPVPSSKKQVQNTIAFFNGKEKKLPVKINGESIYLYSFTSGKHLVLPRGGHESMMAFWLKNKQVTTFFKFTVTPALNHQERQNFKKLDLATLLKDRKITQYRIKEIDATGPVEKHKDLVISAKGKTIKNP